MEKLDARKLSIEALYQQRQTAIRLHQEGMSVNQIAKHLGMSWPAVDGAIKLYEAKGDSALKPAARGRKQGSGRILTDAQEAEIRQFIRGCPIDYELRNSLWDRDSVMQLIKLKYGVTLSVRGMGNYLDRWGLALKKPKTRGSDRCTKEIKKWWNENYKDVERQARETGAEIFWLNKPAAVDADIWCRGQVIKEPCSKTITPDGRRQKVLMVSAVTNQGKVRWAIINGTFNPTQQLWFIKSLIKDTRRKKLFLIRTDKSLCQSGQVRDWLFKNDMLKNVKKVTIFP